MAKKYSDPSLMYGDYIPYHKPLPLQEMIAMGESGKKTEAEDTKTLAETVASFGSLIPAPMDQEWFGEAIQPYKEKALQLATKGIKTDEDRRELMLLKTQFANDPSIKRAYENRQIWDKDWLPKLSDPKLQGAYYENPQLDAFGNVVPNTSRAALEGLKYIPQEDFAGEIYRNLDKVKNEIKASDGTIQDVPGNPYFYVQNGYKHSWFDNPRYKQRVDALTEETLGGTLAGSRWIMANIANNTGFGEAEDMQGAVRNIIDNLAGAYKNDQYETTHRYIGKPEAKTTGSEESTSVTPLYRDFQSYGDRSKSYIPKIAQLYETPPGSVSLTGIPQQQPATVSKYGELSNEDKARVDTLLKGLGKTKDKNGEWSLFDLQLANSYYNEVMVNNKVSSVIIPAKDDKVAAAEGKKIFDQLPSFTLYDPQNDEIINGSDLQKDLKNPDQIRFVGTYPPDNFWSDIIPSDEEQRLLFLRPREITVSSTEGEGSVTKRYILGENKYEYDKNGAQRARDFVVNRITLAKRLGMPVPLSGDIYPGVTIEYNKNTKMYQIYKNGKAIPHLINVDPVELTHRIAFSTDIAGDTDQPVYTPSYTR